MSTPPLSLFLSSLAAYGIYVSIRDYDRISFVLLTGGTWDLARLRDTLVALLTTGEEEQEIFLNRFNEFFATDLDVDPKLEEIDIRQVLHDVATVAERAPDSESARYSESVTTPHSRIAASSQTPETPSIWSKILLAATMLIALLLIAGSFFPFLWTSQPEAKPTPIPTVPTRAPPTEATPEVERQRLYENVPVVTVSTEEIPVEQRNWWLYLALLSGAGAGLYYFYVQRSRHIPEDQPVVWNKEGERHFPLGIIGGEPAPLFDKDELGELADSMGYFLSEEPSSELDVITSIQTTMRVGGIPTLKFQRRYSVRSLLILEDEFAESTSWNPIAQQFADGMERRGIEVAHGRFFGSTGQFRLKNGPIVRLEDIEDQRHGHVMLIFSDGHGVFRHEDKFALEALSHWPAVAWMDLREPRFWNQTAALPTSYNIPLFPATPAGTIQAIRRFLTEQGTLIDYTTQAREGTGIPSSDQVYFDAYIENLLGDAFPWAQACALFHPVSSGLADALRIRFYPHLPAERIGRLHILPDTRKTDAGLYFSANVRRSLRSVFFARCSEDEQEEILRFIQNEIDKLEPEDEESIAHLAWEAARERVHFELAPDEAAERLAMLSDTPVGGSISDSLFNFGFRDEPTTETERIPLRKKPDKPESMQRLARITDNLNISKLDQYPISTLQRAALNGLALLCIVFAGTGLWQYLSPPELDKNWSIGWDNVEPAIIYASLEKRQDESWQPTMRENASGPLSKWPRYLPFRNGD